MLVLTRRKGESLRINDNIMISIVRLDHESVRVGVQAPKEISVHREEIYQLRQAQGDNRQ